MMPTNTFRLSTYLTLAASCACLGYAEAPLTVVAPVVAGVVVALLAALFFAEERLPLLSIPAANRLGLLIALGAVAWLLYQTGQTPGASLAERIAPSRILPAVGPVLLVLMPAKLVRREKHVGDYWTLHGCGLAAVALAAAMGDDPVTFGLAMGYAVLAVWSLSLFFVARSSRAVPPVPGSAPAGTVEFHAGTGGRTDLARGLLLAGAAAAVALPLYVLTPRSAADRLDFGKNRIEVGFAAEQMTDLNRTGDLKNNPEVAFEVLARGVDGREKTDLNPSQLWRGTMLAYYANGSWSRGDTRAPTARNPITFGGTNWTPPNLGPSRYSLVYSVPAKLKATPVAAPFQWVPGGQAPVASQTPQGNVIGWPAGKDGTMFDSQGYQSIQWARYIQVTVDPPEPGLGTGYELTGGFGSDFGLRPLLANPVPAVREYANQLRDSLAAAGKLPRGAVPDPAQPGRQEARLQPAEQYHEAIARAFAAHLAESPEFNYTTTLRRENKKQDPVEEFLTGTKSGHCERFASALTLMLRSQGIPAVFVLGFKGAEHTEGGNYVVRQEHAHAWVEALIPRQEPGGPRIWHWLTLDPTPGTDGTATEQASLGLWQRIVQGVRSAFRNYVMNYTPEQQQAAIRSAAGWLSEWRNLAGVAGVVVALVAVRRYRRRGRAAPDDRHDAARWFGRLLAVLAAHGYAPADGETPREFAAAAGDALRDRAGPLADVPAEWAEAYYHARFGDVPLPDDRRAELERRLGELEQVLGRA